MAMRSELVFTDKESLRSSTRGCRSTGPCQICGAPLVWGRCGMKHPREDSETLFRRKLKHYRAG